MSRLLKSTLVGLFLTAAVTVGPGLHPARASGTAQGPDGALRTAYTHVRVTVEGHVARTEVDQVFVNDLPSPVEATFGFPLPADATVTGFADWRDGKKVDAQVAGHDQAAAQYEAAAAAGRRAALAETEGDRFHVRLFAIPGRGSRRISLTYVQTVDALGSTRTLVFPAEHVAKPSVLDLDVDVSGAGSVEALTAPNHADTQLSAGRAILSRAGRGLDHDFVLRWREKAASLDLAGRAARSVKFGADEPGYLETTFSFNADPFDGTRAPRDVVLVLDASLSMAGEPLQRSRAMALRTLDALGPNDRVALLVVRNRPEPWIPTLLPVNAPEVGRARKSLENLRAGGRTDLSDAIADAGRLLSMSEDGVLLLATDGQPTEDGGDGGDTFGLDVDAGAFENVRVLVATFLWPRRAADLQALFPDARARYIPDGPAGEAVVGELARLAAAPVIEDLSVQVEGGGAFEVEGALPARLALGDAVRLMGRVSGATTIRAEGTLHGAPIALEIPVNLPTAATTGGDLLALEWARLRASGLESQLGRADDAERESLADEIQGLGLTYGIATRLTSFVTTDDADTLAPDRIKPGDPEIRVHAPRGARQVVAVLPWGEVTVCSWDEHEGLWLGRFLVPRGLPDGLYRARVLVETQAGVSSRGTLFFRVDSAPPAFELTVETPADFPDMLRFVARPVDHVFDDDGVPTAPGDSIVRDRVDLDLRTLSIQIDDVELRLVQVGRGERWEAFLPADLSPGRHTARLVAVDYALNSTATDVDFEVP